MATNAPANNLSVFTLLEALKRRKLLVIIPTLLLGLGFSVYAYRQPSRYRAQALLAAEHMTPPEYLKEVAPTAMNIKEHLWTVREVLYSPKVLQQAARELKVYRDASTELPPEAIESFKSSINLRVESEHTFDILYEGNDPQEVAAVTNKLAELFVKEASANRQIKGQETKAVIDEELEKLKGRLEEQSKRIHSYKQSAVRELPDHSLENMRMVDELQRAHQDKGTKIAEAEARRTGILRQMRELESKGALESPMEAEKSAAELKLEALRLQFKDMQTKLTAKHPDLARTQREITNLEQAVASQPKAKATPNDLYLRHVALKTELDEINQLVNSYKQEQYGLASQLADYRARVSRAPVHERALEDMQREYEVGNEQFHALLDKQLDSNLSQGLETMQSGIAFQVIEPASVPSAPFSPQRERLILMGIFAGLGLGLVMAFFVEQNDTTFGTVDDFQAFTSLPLTGVIPTIEQKSGVVTVTDPESVAAEQYRILAMKVQQQLESQNENVLLLTSAAGGEGKSLTAINLAMALASTAEGPVLLVDGDMRKPRLHEYLKLNPTSTASFHGLLSNPDDDLSKYIVKVKNLDVIPGVAASGNPVAALASPKTRNLVDRLKGSYKFVIIDAPPTLPIADSHILSGLSDKVLFVVRARKTPRELFQHAVESFEASNLLGAVLNDVDYQRSRYAYAYEYYKEKAR